MQAMRSDISREGYHCRFQHRTEAITEKVRVGANLAETSDSQRDLLP